MKSNEHIWNITGGVDEKVLEFIRQVRLTEKFWNHCFSEYLWH